MGEGEETAVRWARLRSLRIAVGSGSGSELRFVVMVVWCSGSWMSSVVLAACWRDAAGSRCHVTAKYTTLFEEKCLLTRL